MTVDRHGQYARCAATFTLPYGFSLFSSLNVVGETRPTSKMPVTFVAGDTNVGERARSDRHRVAAILVTGVCYTASTTFME